MPLDAICLSALRQELTREVLGARIDKIHQPARDEIILALRGKDNGGRLLLSASPTRPRAQMTTLSRENPAEPPMFCMLLRKHLVGGRIVAVEQPSMERLLQFSIEASNELGDKVLRTLVLEVMGRHANLLLLDEEGRILDCLRKVDFDMSKGRQLLPGMFYRLPPEQGKENPLSLLEAVVERESPREETIDSYLLRRFAGISPLIARELAFELGGAVDAPLTDQQQALQGLKRLMEKVAAGDMTPYLLLRDGSPVDFSFRPILQYGAQTQSIPQESFSALLDRFYVQREGEERIRQKGQELIKSATTARDRTARRLGFQRKELEETADREKLRQLGDLITANLYRMEKGMGTLEAENFYDPDMAKVSIKLDPLKTPQQNAARYYKDYNRMKTAEVVLTQQIQKGEEELRYLNSVLESFHFATGERDLEEIRQEMVEQGYVRRRAKVKGRMKPVKSKPLEYRSSAGLLISVGRTNTQNDLLTTKQAGKTDIWLHTQKIHGAHVILSTQGETPDAQSLYEAALLAAWYSQGRESSRVPVDYTPVKFVKKPAGARPGMVIYTTYETMYVTPEAEQVGNLEKQK